MAYEVETILEGLKIVCSIFIVTSWIEYVRVRYGYRSFLMWLIHYIRRILSFMTFSPVAETGAIKLASAEAPYRGPFRFKCRGHAPAQVA